MSQEDGGGEQDRAQNCQWSIYIALTTTRATTLYKGTSYPNLVFCTYSNYYISGKVYSRQASQYTGTFLTYATLEMEAGSRSNCLY